MIKSRTSQRLIFFWFWKMMTSHENQIGIDYRLLYLLPIGSLHILESIREVSFYGSDRELAYQQSTLKY